MKDCTHCNGEMGLCQPWLSVVVSSFGAGFGGTESFGGAGS